jgi:hypothetical protein
MTTERGVLSGKIAVSCERSGTVHGVGLWYRINLAPGITIEPDFEGKAADWYSAFLPISKPIDVEAGASIELQVRVVPFESWCTWDWSVRAEGKPAVSQSNAFNLLKQRHKLPALPPNAPEVTRATGVVLASADGKTSADELVAMVMNRFPATFTTIDAAQIFVAGVLHRHGLSLLHRRSADRLRRTTARVRVVYDWPSDRLPTLRPSAARRVRAHAGGRRSTLDFSGIEA